MNKVLKGLVAVAASAAMAVAGMFGAGTAMAANTYQITVPAEDTHTYSVYQIFTGSLSKDNTLVTSPLARTSIRIMVLAREALI
mgnify:CR=1 FL=1